MIWTYGAKKKKKEKNRNTRQWGIICKREIIITEMKQVIEKESNLLNKIISHFFFHTGLGWLASPI